MDEKGKFAGMKQTTFQRRSGYPLQIDRLAQACLPLQQLCLPSALNGLFNSPMLVELPRLQRRPALAVARMPDQLGLEQRGQTVDSLSKSF